jgi:hypothetical protein
MSALTFVGYPEPSGTTVQVATVLRALRQWRVNQIVIAGASRDPVYATGFFTMVLGTAPTEEAGAQVWSLPRGIPAAKPALGGSLSLCRDSTENVARANRASVMAHCVLFGAGRT